MGPETFDVGRGRRGPAAAGVARGCALALLCLAVVACGERPARGGDSGAEGASSETTRDTRPGGSTGPVGGTAVDSTEWTAGRLSAPATLDGGPPPLPVLTALRTGVHPAYERFTVELDSPGGLPGYRIEYVDRPLHECGSGRQVFPVGDAWLELRLEPAAAHTEAGEATLGDREVPVAGAILRRVYRTCDFEGVVTLVLAVSTPNPFRVVTLSDPPRLAVDVATTAGRAASGDAAQAAVPGVLVWSAAELERRSLALGERIGADGSARETLADYGTPDGSHRFRFIRRDGDGRPEQHDGIDDVVFVQSGGGAVVVGGDMLGRVGDLGEEIRGGTRYDIGAGDVLRIPAGVPHEYVVGEGDHITYLLVRLPAYRGPPDADPDGEPPQLDPPGFGLWRASELRRRDVALATRVGADGSARETLADYGPGGGSHRFRFLRRERDGRPELHDDIIDVVFVRSGAGTLLAGGSMSGRSNAAGSEITGASRHPVAEGDVLHIPAGVPHAYLVGDAGHVTYVLVRVPGAVLQ